MSLDPTTLLARLRNADAMFGINLRLAEAVWLLNALAHRDAQIKALQELVAKPAAEHGAPIAPVPATGTPTETFGQEVDRITSVDRQATYGRPADDFARTSAMWEPIFGLPPGAISPDKVALAMICVKVSRLCHGFKRDSALDIAGYARTIDMIHAEMAVDGNP